MYIFAIYPTLFNYMKTVLSSYIYSIKNGVFFCVRLNLY